MFTVIIKGKFTTGTTQDDPEEAKETCRRLLRERLEKASCLRTDQIFQFMEEAIEVEKL